MHSVPERTPHEPASTTKEKLLASTAITIDTCSEAERKDSAPKEKQASRLRPLRQKRAKPLPAAPHQRQGDRASGDDGGDVPPRKFLTGPQVCERYSITDMSLWRWLDDPALNFPKPTMIVQRRRFWDEAILRKWELSRIAAREVA
jgi:predicted DNA-binding transcriptional regulator AlpA